MKRNLPIGAKPAPLANAVATTLPGVLLANQQRWVDCTDRVMLWEKSRRIGASWSTASLAVLNSSAKNGSDTLYIGYSEDMTREFIDDCAMWASKFNSVVAAVGEVMFDDTDENGDTRQIKAFRIDFASGFKILALSSRPRSIRGKQGLVIIDEAAWHDDFNGLMKAALAMLIWGGRVLVLSSHNGEDNPFNILIKDTRAGKYRYKVFRTTFRDAIADGLYRRICLKQGIEWTQKGEDEFVDGVYADYGENSGEELDVIPAKGGGVYFSRSIIEQCQDATVPTVLFKCAPEFVSQEDRIAVTEKWFLDNVKPVIDAMLPDKRTAFGQDFGRSGDLSAAWPFQEIRPRHWRQACNLEMRNVPFDCQRHLITRVLESLPLLQAAKFDARGNGQAHAEAMMQKFGASKVECVMLTQAWYAEHFPKYKAAMEAVEMTICAGEDVIADHRRVVLNKGIPKIDDGHDKGSDGGQRHGDTAVAGVLAWAAAASPPWSAGYQGAGRRHAVKSAETSDDFDTRSRSALV